MFEYLWSLDFKSVFEISRVFNHFQIDSWLITSAMGFQIKFFNYVVYVSNEHSINENFTNPSKILFWWIFKHSNINYLIYTDIVFKSVKFHTSYLQNVIKKKPFIIDIIKNLRANASPIKLHPSMLLIYKDCRNDRKLNVVICFLLKRK